MADRVLHFVNSGEQDVSEVRISTGVHTASPANPLAKITYTVSYPQTVAATPQSLKETFAKAADAIIDDASKPGFNPGSS